VRDFNLIEREEKLSLLYIHQDQVSVLPQSSKLLAQSDFCPIESFKVGEHILTFQGHPEFTKEFALKRYDVQAKVIGENVLKAGLDSLKRIPGYSDVWQQIMEFTNL
jgi:GMP synthase-like glutamine amidotransferase